MRRELKESHGNQDHKFFDESAEDLVQKRMQCCQDAMNDMKAFINKKIGSASDNSDANSPSKEDHHTAKVRVGFFDATNATRERRRWIVKELKGSGAKVWS